MIDLVWKIWSRRQWLAVVAFVLLFAVAVGVWPSLPNLYRATAIVLLDRQMVPESYVRSTVTYPPTRMTARAARADRAAPPPATMTRQHRPR